MKIKMLRFSLLAKWDFVTNELPDNIRLRDCEEHMLKVNASRNLYHSHPGQDDPEMYVVYPVNKKTIITAPSFPKCKTRKKK